MFIDRDMWIGNPPANPAEAARRRNYFLSVHELPKKGWNLQQITDAGDDTQQCEVCGMYIRWNAHINHYATRGDDGLPVELRTGMECRAAVTGDVDAASQWTKEWLSLLRRRGEWLKGWTPVTPGQSAKKRMQGGRVVVMRNPPGWSYSIRQNYQWTYGPKGFVTPIEAALAAFDAINPPPGPVLT